VSTFDIPAKKIAGLSGSGKLVRLNDVKLFKQLKTTIMEKFMFIFHGGISPDSSPEKMQENMGKWMGWIERLSKEGRYVSGEPLLPGGKLVKGNASGVTDGPYTEGKEVVGGYFIVNAADYKDAVSLCAGYPDYDDGGSVQVRQIMKIEM
jgi:hypothetical protein